MSQITIVGPKERLDSKVALLCSRCGLSWSECKCVDLQAKRARFKGWLDWFMRDKHLPDYLKKAVVAEKRGK